MHFLRGVAGCCAAAALAACSYVNPVAVARLATLSPFEAEPGDLAVIVALPEWAYVAPGSARFVIYSERSDTGQSLNEEFILQAKRTENGAERFAIATADLERVRAAQKTVGQWEEEAPRANSGGFSATFHPCIVSGAEPDAEDLYSVWIELDPKAAAAPLVRNAPVKTVLDQLEAGPSGSDATLCDGK